MTRVQLRKTPRPSLVVALALLLSGCAFVSPPQERSPGDVAPAQRAAAPAGPLRAGVACEDATPEGSAYVAGFGVMKRSTGVHDPITLRALVIERGTLRVAILAVDSIGLHAYWVEALRERVRDLIAPAGLWVAASHTHAGPDTFGLWGLPPLWSGIDSAYQARLLDLAERALRRALADLSPARLRVGQAQALGLSKNKRDPKLLDRTLSAIAFDHLDGRPLATLVHFACHPEALGSGNSMLSADFPGPLRRRVERGRPGAPTLFLNGALGGMVTTTEREHTFAEVERIGGALGSLALKALGKSRALPRELPLRCTRRVIRVPVQLRTFHLAASLGIFGPRSFAGGTTASEVCALRLGPWVLLSMPGEALPALGFKLQGLIRGQPALVVGLVNDELGYLIPAKDYGAHRYRYERTVSPGPLVAPLLLDAARAALADVGALK